MEIDLTIPEIIYPFTVYRVRACKKKEITEGFCYDNRLAMEMKCLAVFALVYVR